jgi:hypothetical protein
MLATASDTCGDDLPYSTAIERSTAVSSSPTSTVTPRVWPEPPPTLSRTPPTVRVAPPICTASTSWAAMPATWETTVMLMVVLPCSAMFVS